MVSRLEQLCAEEEMGRFGEFLELARQWPVLYVVRVASCRMEYEACLAMGCTEGEIIDGTREWMKRHTPLDTTNFRPPAPHTWLREQSFLAYQPKEPRLRAVE